jgi:hypothetical protein
LSIAAIGGLALTASAADTPVDPGGDGSLIQAEELANYSLSVGSAKAKVGSQTTLTVTVTAKGKFKGNPKYPHKIKGISAANVDAPKKVRGAANGKTISFSIPVTPTKAGTHNLSGQIKFGICDDSQCVMKKAQLTATVQGT